MMKQKCKSIDNTMSFGNGVTTSKDGKYVYVTESVSKLLNIYQRIPANDDNTDGYKWVHKKIRSVSTPTVCDNLFIDSKSDYIWTACHPSVKEFLSYQIYNSPVCFVFVTFVLYTPHTF